ncbi:MAG: CvpA family protein [Alphaproteobacteria bacterium]
MDSLPFNPMDAIVVVVVLLSALVCLSLGFVHVILAISAWVGAGLVTMAMLPVARPVARQLAGEGRLFDTVPYADLAAGLALFLVSLVILWLISHFISERIRRSALNVLDRSLGALLGLAIGALMVSMAYAAYSWVVPIDSQPQWVREARATPLVRRGADRVGTVMLRYFGSAEPAAGLVIPLPVIDDAVGGITVETEDTAPAAGYTNDQTSDLDRLVDQVDSEDHSP